MNVHWQESSVAADRTHHVLGSEPIYATRFIEVLSFHAPGLAAVRDTTGAHHIRTDGTAVYERRFKRTFGFYEGRAAVEDETGAHHIDESGREIGDRRFAWCGNFQGGACTIRDSEGQYFHICLDGEPIYAKRWKYAGDFREGAAVVLNDACRHHHIDRRGEDKGLGHFLDLDVFHKGFARARDEGGWFHLRLDGSPAYSQRYVAVEPFYNGQARCEGELGTLVAIDESGLILRRVRT